MSQNVVLSGNLAFLSLAEVLQLLGQNGSNGTLELKTKYAPEPGFVYFSAGNPINAVNSEWVGIDAMFSLFGWTEGEFVFTEETPSVDNIISQSRMEIILDGLRKLDDGEIPLLEPVSFDKTADSDSKDKPAALPTIKGPLVDYLYVVDEEEFFDEEEIVQEGNHGNWIWVVLEGKVDISKSTPRGPLKLLRISEGAFVGSIASFLSDNSVRHATAVASGNVQLGMLDSQGLSSEFSRMSSDMKTIIKSLDKRLREVTSSAVASYLEKNESDRLLKNQRPVIRPGKNDDRAFLITEGRAMVTRKTEASLVPLIRLGKGDFIGRIPFLEMGLEPNSAMVTGNSNLKVIPIDVAALQSEFDGLTPTFKNIVENLATSIMATAMVTCSMEKERLKVG
jgi:CRP-like cAMP-binding protein